MFFFFSHLAGVGCCWFFVWCVFLFFFLIFFLSISLFWFFILISFLFPWSLPIYRRKGNLLSTNGTDRSFRVVVVVVILLTFQVVFSQIWLHGCFFFKLPCPILSLLYHHHIIFICICRLFLFRFFFFFFIEKGVGMIKNTQQQKIPAATLFFFFLFFFFCWKFNSCCCFSFF